MSPTETVIGGRSGPVKLTLPEPRTHSFLANPKFCERRGVTTSLTSSVPAIGACEAAAENNNMPTIRQPS